MKLLSKLKTFINDRIESELEEWSNIAHDIIEQVKIDVDADIKKAVDSFKFTK